MTKFTADMFNIYGGNLDRATFMARPDLRVAATDMEIAAFNNALEYLENIPGADAILGEIAASGIPIQINPRSTYDYYQPPTPANFNLGVVLPPDPSNSMINWNPLLALVTKDSNGILRV